MGDILRATSWPDNAHMMADVARLGYLDGTILDTSWGLGSFWTQLDFGPDLACELNPTKARDLRCDFRQLPFADQSFDVVVCDPPYKFQGTSQTDSDENYGIDENMRWQDRLQLIVDGAAECARVARRILLVKCQDQVVSGKVVWQTDHVTEAVAAKGKWRKRDRFDLLRTPRPQRSQKHARSNYSTLLVFQRL